MFEVDKDWEPARDEDGKAIPITYYFSSSNAQEECVGSDRTSVEDKPATKDMLFKEARVLAKDTAIANPGDRPWTGWQVNVIADDLYDDGPFQVGFFRFSELLNL